MHVWQLVIFDHEYFRHFVDEKTQTSHSIDFFRHQKTIIIQDIYQDISQLVDPASTTKP